MDYLWSALEQPRRLAVDLLHSHEIDNSSPWSPEVPEDLPIHNVWILDNTAFRIPAPGDHRRDLAKLRDHNATKPRLVSEPGQTTQSVQQGTGKWEVEFVVAYFIKNSGKEIASTTAALVKQLNVDDSDEATKKRITARLQPFVDHVLPKRTLRITIDDKEEQTLGPSSYSGISSDLIPLHFDPSGPQAQSNALTLPPPFGLGSTTVFAEEEGWGIISDIDDTIKVTQSSDPIGILKNTFIVEKPDPIAGMPELYAHILPTLTTNNNGSENAPPFFYLSASPYNLYPFLRHFLNAHYPQGTTILRDASWQNLGGLIASLQKNTKEYKVDRIVKIHSWFPHRKFIAIGDSTQSDPEAYGECARRFPGWIKAIFIRKVEGIALMDEKTKNADARFEKAFEQLDRSLWHVFTEPSEVAERIDELRKDEDVQK
ncbi:hypothetical protein LTR27_005825 [Elasticomyces elasticus]|nr:hypothetical protein LTR27_005825 [Elasticomyces elasticus]